MTMNIKTVTRRMSGILGWAEGSKIRRNARDGGTTRNAVAMRKKIKRMINRRLRRLAGFVEDSEEIA
jgi:hypothetical protein